MTALFFMYLGGLIVHLLGLVQLYPTLKSAGILKVYVIAGFFWPAAPFVGVWNWLRHGSFRS